MSAGAPFSIWRARAELAAKENFTGIEESLVKPSPTSCSALVKEAAAKTMMVGLSVGAAELGRQKSNSQSIDPGREDFFRRLFPGIRTLPVRFRCPVTFHRARRGKHQR